MKKSASRKLTVTIRRKSQPNKPFKEQLTRETLIEAVHRDTAGKPFRPLLYPAGNFQEEERARYI